MYLDISSRPDIRFKAVKESKSAIKRLKLRRNGEWGELEDQNMEEVGGILGFEVVDEGVKKVEREKEAEKEKDERDMTFEEISNLNGWRFEKHEVVT